MTEEKKDSPPVNKKTLDQEVLYILKMGIIVMLGFAFMMGVFGVGIWVGQKRAEFSFHWMENYQRNFGGPGMGMAPNFINKNTMGAHGIFGTVIKIDGTTLIIKGKNAIEESVEVLPGTTIVNNAGVITISDIKINDAVVIIGSPDDLGEVEAKFIRILPQVTSFLTNRPVAY